MTPNKKKSTKPHGNPLKLWYYNELEYAESLPETVPQNNLVEGRILLIIYFLRQK